LAGELATSPVTLISCIPGLSGFKNTQFPSDTETVDVSNFLYLFWAGYCNINSNFTIKENPCHGLEYAAVDTKCKIVAAHPVGGEKLKGCSKNTKIIILRVYRYGLVHVRVISFSSHVVLSASLEGLPKAVIHDEICLYLRSSLGVPKYMNSCRLHT
jgi:hypothetical protein